MNGESTLDQIPQGGSVRVSSVIGDDPIGRRLADLGIRKGVEITVVRRAPLGDPTVFELCGYQLCLRRSESGRIRVEPSGPASGTDATSGRRDDVA
jgi:ferrous iron transport protein A